MGFGPALPKTWLVNRPVFESYFFFGGLKADSNYFVEELYGFEGEASPACIFKLTFCV